MGRDGTTGERMIVLGRSELLSISVDEECALIPGCMLLVGTSNFCCSDEPDKVLLSASTDVVMTSFSDGVTCFDEALELRALPQTLQKLAPGGSSLSHL